MMTVILVVLHVIVCFVLILVILLQAGRGQGLATSSFGGGNVQTLFGTRAGDFLTKATSVSAICFLLTCITLDVIEAQKSKSLLDVSRKKAPIDIDKIKKALEKIKAGQPLTPEDLGQKAGTEMPLTIPLGAQTGDQVPGLPTAGNVPPDEVGKAEWPAGNAQGIDATQAATDAAKALDEATQPQKP
ncbi:MAG: preprotein translocase subunit SecG [Candidatus Omnitrophica bacterium]|nr:preprotein translocase subunit SecG [Candidatus Omnitrophota bacterium]MDD5670655.1 preprotein translocase subunit SecG [Candidatus Omnitrophota bacterium]